MSTRKYPDDFINKIICGDCLEVMKEMPNECVNMILTDPPYGVNKATWDDEGVFIKSLPFLYRLLKEDSYLIVYGAIKKIPTIINTIENAGFVYVWQYILYWSNINNIIHSPLGRCVYTPIFFFKKGNPKRSQYLVDVHKYCIRTNEIKIGHPTPKPVSNLEKLILFGSQEEKVIFDPFIGSGSVGVACKNLHRNFIGIEISPDYCKIAEERLAQGVL